MFEVAYETTFCATHVLTDGGRPIEPVHGHDWRVEVVAAGDSLDRIGVVVDFEHLKEAVGEVCRRFHYKDINAHPAFAGRSPSAEEVARYFFEEVRAGMGAEGQSLRRVRVWEAPGCSATYTEAASLEAAVTKAAVTAAAATKAASTKAAPPDARNGGGP